MSWNSSAKRKCNDQELLAEDNLRRLNRPLINEKQEHRGCSSAEALRWARITALQAAIKEGSYRIAAEHVADSLLAVASRHDTARQRMYSA